MTIRRLVWLGVPACLALVVGSTVWRARPHPVNRANFERIREGMTRADVAAVFKCPPGDYATVAYFPEYCGFTIAGATRWISNDGDVRVWFDDQGQVRDTSFFKLLVSKPPSLLDRLRAWLGW